MFHDRNIEATAEQINKFRGDSESNMNVSTIKNREKNYDPKAWNLWFCKTACLMVIRDSGSTVACSFQPEDGL